MLNSNNKFIVPIITLIVVMALLFASGDMLLNKVADRVLERIRRNYTPGPYDPGFDPDKVNGNLQPTPDGKPVDYMGSPDSWNRYWENAR